MLTLLLGTSASAEHANIDLRVVQNDPATGAIVGQASAFADTEPPAGGLNPRPHLKVKAGVPCIVQFIFINTYPHHDLKDATITYFVARVDKLRQKTPPDLTKAAVTQGRFTLNFKPKGKVGVRQTLTLPAPGIYLLRVQSGNTDSDHEHFAAIDLEAEK
jgi:hypothetical protein